MTNGRKVCCGSIEHDSSGSSFAFEHIRFKAVAVFTIGHKDSFVDLDTCVFQQNGINRDRPHVVRIAIGDDAAVNLRKEILSQHFFLVQDAGDLIDLVGLFYSSKRVSGRVGRDHYERRSTNDSATGFRNVAGVRNATGGCQAYLP